ncbi:uncharacterized protein LOC119646675 isoform X1 [Hermetia illucens]|uniref:uncharacterized protein LOC119646675 isoform X1 n=1 Tax=Hermetia illucens TaxID=343691 RepID=UPI0018CC68B2|nr:uncharacterized protein LOC119646675 isoform X1 [Hermetia illucens]
MFRSGIPLILLLILLVQGKSFSSVVSATSGETHKLKFHLRSERSIVSKEQLLQTRNFFQLFNIPYIICFFAATGKWPFIPPLLQVKVNQVSRSLFIQNDEYIKNYCQEWITIVQCHRPFPTTEAPTSTMSTTTMEATEPEPEETTTECVCGRRSIARVPNNEIVFLDRTFVGNVSVETIQATIQFLRSLLPLKRKKRPSNKNRG